jgi:putative transposase
MRRVDNQRVVSGIVFVIKNWLRWRDAPKEYAPHKTLYNRFIRWSRMGVFDRILANLPGQRQKPDRLIIDATHLKAHRRSERLSLTVNVRLPASLFKKGPFPAASTARKAA